MIELSLEELAILFSKEINDLDITKALEASGKAMDKVLPGRIAFAEKVMQMTDSECYIYLKERGIVL